MEPDGTSACSRTSELGGGSESAFVSHASDTPSPGRADADATGGIPAPKAASWSRNVPSDEHSAASTYVVGDPPDRASRLWLWRAGAPAIALTPLIVCLVVAITALCAAGGPQAQGTSTISRQLAANATGAAWRSAEVTAIFPSTLEPAGDGGYRRLGIAPLAGCAVLPAALRARLAAAHCLAVLRATYVDTTRTTFATLGVIVLDGPASARAALARNWQGTAADDNPALLPETFPVANTIAAGFDDASRVGWHAVVGSDGSYLCYAVTGFADGRRGSSPAELRSGAWRSADSPPGQAAQDLPATINAELDAAVGALEDRS
jgi:hypothetical protein